MSVLLYILIRTSVGKAVSSVVDIINNLQIRKVEETFICVHRICQIEIIPDCYAGVRLDRFHCRTNKLH